MNIFAPPYCDAVIEDQPAKGGFLMFHMLWCFFQYPSEWMKVKRKWMFSAVKTSINPI